MKWFALAALPAAIALSGCTGWLDVPRADNHPESSQPKAFAAHHWDVLANDVVAQMRSALDRSMLSGYPISLTPSRENTAFAVAFRNFLISHMVQAGMNVSLKSTNINVQVDVQVIHHQSQVSNRANYYPFTALTGGLFVARGLNLIYETHPMGDFGFAATTAAAGAAVAADLTQLHSDGRAYGGPTRTEVIVTTAMLDKERFISQRSDIYYIEGVDDVLYANYKTGTPMKEWKLVVQ
ncbi:conserved hypothetical protein [Gammaproteobacteria bacterium]